MHSSATTIDITPTRPVVLGAGGGTSNGIRDRLEANVILLHTDESAPVVIVTLDLLYPGRHLRELVERSLPFEPSRIFIAASHSHNAPMTDDTKPRLGAVERNYVKWVAEKIVDVVPRLQARVKPTSLHVAQGSANHSINRRRKKLVVVSRRLRFNTVALAPNPVGTVDETVSVITATTAGKVQWILWNYACHPVAYPHAGVISSHFPGIVRERIRRRAGTTALPVGFLQGFSGNTRPAATATPRGTRARLLQLVQGPIFHDMSDDVYRAWANGLTEVVLPLVSAGAMSEPSVVDCSRVSYPLSDFVRGRRDGVASFHALTIDNAATIVGVSAEVVAEYAPFVRRLSRGRTLCVGCLDDTFGYAPTAEMLGQGGYEAGGYCADFGLLGVSPFVEKNMMRGFTEVIRGVYDKL